MCVTISTAFKKDFQVNKGTSLKVGGMVSSVLSWGSLEAVLLGKGTNDSYEAFINLIFTNYTNIESSQVCNTRGSIPKVAGWPSCGSGFLNLRQAAYVSFMTFTIPIRYDYTNLALGMEHGTGDQTEGHQDLCQKHIAHCSWPVLCLASCQICCLLTSP